MRYKHRRHAGNHGDVLKHTAMLSQLDSLLQEKGNGKILYFDSHAGSGMYATSERSEVGGIGRVLSHFDKLLPRSGEIQQYLTTIRSFRNQRNGKESKCAYPGSPILAACMLCPHDRGLFCDTQPTEAASLTSALKEMGVVNPQVSVRVEDGYNMLQERLLETSPLGRALLLIDPPFEDTESDFEAVSQLANAFLNKMPKDADEAVKDTENPDEARAMIWYPIKEGHDTSLAKWKGRLRDLNAGSKTDCRLAFAEIWMSPRCSSDGNDCSGRSSLVGSGLAIFSSYCLAMAKLRSWIPELHAALDPESKGGCSIEFV
uniref:Ribosomal RNA large subunit methyltransferase J n=1 Tax=Odontella aurita TaxID=265563 RepID=A0A7S4IXB1_9STRA|mmetsp:Transcript_32100/g.96184  ORF Transcript_32100/g.96184 Transcript_32100/m.96184 type:complete len:317 (+) Transcript_32100:332-1282(+)